jgi:hypothetical protein
VDRVGVTLASSAIVAEWAGGKGLGVLINLPATAVRYPLMFATLLAIALRRLYLIVVPWELTGSDRGRSKGRQVRSWLVHLAGRPTPARRAPFRARAAPPRPGRAVVVGGASGVMAQPTASAGPSVPTRLTVGLGYIPSVQFAQFYLADEAGYYEEAGLEVTFQNKVDPELITLLAQGSVDIGIADGTSLIPAVSQGIPVVYGATMYERFNVVFAPWRHRDGRRSRGQDHRPGGAARRIVPTPAIHASPPRHLVLTYPAGQGVASPRGIVRHRS